MDGDRRGGGYHQGRHHLCLRCHENTVSLYEPVYTDGGDSLYVIGQISDKKNLEEMWVEHLSLSEAMKRLRTTETHIIDLRFSKERPRQRSPTRSVSARRRCPVSKKMH